MTKTNSKKALLSSAFALVLSVAMLIGTTFAWFTDTASTGVNKIVSGNLKVDIIGENSDSHIEKLNFKKAAATDAEAGAAILWEPGCRYLTEGFRIANKGNLALKWKAQVNMNNIINGKVEGSTIAKDGKSLLDVIDFYVVTSTDENAEAVAIENFVGNLNAGAKSGVYYIKGVMQTTAGNDYQDLTLDGITVTVIATQDTVENDSFGNTYDENAMVTAADYDALAKAVKSGGLIKLGADVEAKATLTFGGDAHLDLAGKTLNNTSDIWGDNDWSLISAQNGVDVVIDGNGTVKAKENDCFAVDVQDGSAVTIKSGTFVGNIHAVYVYEGTAIIEGGTYSVQQKYPDASKANEFVLNCYDSSYKNGTAKIVVKGGTFINFNPADCQAEGAHTNFVADGYSVVSETKANGDVWYTVVKFNNLISKGGNITVSEDVKTDNIGDTAADRVIISNPTTLNLDAKIISPDNMGNNGTNFCALIVDADTTINASENGGIDTGENGGYGINVRNGATLTINGGSYYGGGTAVQVQKGTLIINGGHFAVEPFGAPYGTNFLLNCIDSAYKNGTAKIIVRGGTFVNFDPSNNTAEGAGTNFVAGGYKVVSENKTNGEIWYTVVADN